MVMIKDITWRTIFTKRYFVLTMLSVAVDLSSQFSLAMDKHPELLKSASAPIVHRKYYIGERELFGYSPLFKPNTVTFDLYNRPYIRNAGIIQTLRDGNWIEIDLKSYVQKLIPRWNGVFLARESADERIVFDKDGCAYTILNAMESNLRTSFLLYSKDNCKTWEIFTLPPANARLEFNDHDNLLEYPPAVIIYDGHILNLLIPEKTKQNTLKFSESIPISSSSLVEHAHSGAGNPVVSVGSTIHIVWAGSEEISGRDGTPQYAATYDRNSKKLSAPVLLGFGGRGKPDGHCAPAITVDNKNYLHVVLSAHTTKLQYVKSLEPNSTIGGWAEPIDIGGPALQQWGNYYTYVALCCDKKDTLHVVARLWSGEYGETCGGSYKEYLVYLRKQKDKQWEPPKPLVVPFHTTYSIYYHKLNIDRKGRLFVNYMYYADGLTTDELAAYRAKWPNDKIKYNDTTPEDSRQYWNVYPHDPAILMSDDGGDTWRLAVTKDFVDGGL